MDHDQNFKNLLIDYSRDALAFFAGAEAQGTDNARILPVRQEQLKGRLGDRFRELDVPLLVEWPNGGREALLFVLEEDTDPRRFSVHRLAHYCLDLAELLETDRVVPVVIFLRDGSFRAELTLGGHRHNYLTFNFLSCVLARLSWEAYRDSDNLVARLNLTNMRYDPAERVEVYAQAVQGLLELEPDPEKQVKYLDFVDIYSALSDNERAQYRQIYPEAERKMSQFAERFEQLGVQQGVRQGVQQGEVAILLRQIEAKFGVLSAEYRKRITQADADTLLNWSVRLLTANTVEEVLTDGDNTPP